MALLDISVPAFIEASVPGQFLVDLLPALKYVPAWVPGAGFQRKAARWSEAIVKTCDDPWNEAKAKLVNVINMATIPGLDALAPVRETQR